jgi:hypothetical protein
LAHARQAFDSGGELTFWEVLALRRDIVGDLAEIEKSQPDIMKFYQLQKEFDVREANFAAQLAKCKLKESSGWIEGWGAEYYRKVPGVTSVMILMDDPYRAETAGAEDASLGRMILASIPETQTQAMKYGQRIVFSGDLALVNGEAAVRNARFQLLEDDPVVPVPTEADLQGLHVVLQRGGCYGTCPVYTLTIEGDGGVTFEGQYFTQVKGTATAKISTADLLAIVSEVRKTGFFSLQDSYTADVTDNPTYWLTVQLGGQSKTVKDYVAGPVRLDMLLDRIDQIADSGQWIH